MTNPTTVPARAAAPVDVAVIGAGAIGCATAAYLMARGHRVRLWAPRASHLEPREGKAQLSCVGAMTGKFELSFLAEPSALADFGVVIVCLPGNAYADVLAPLNRLWRNGQTLIVSGSLSLCPLWIQESAQSHGQSVQVAGWGTTVTTAHFLSAGTLHVNPLRERIDLAAKGAGHAASALALCQRLLGDRFALADNLLVPTLANINPIAHAAEVIPNLTRMDLGEAWPLFGCFSPVVGRIAEALDRERLAVAQAFAFELPSLKEHYSRSYQVPVASLHTMAALIHARGMGPHGPTHLDHRYVLEDGPFGLAFLEALAALAQVETPMLSSCITLLAFAYGRDFRDENFLMSALSLRTTDVASLRRRCADAQSAARFPL
ncbi:hypothetical protein RD110_22480 [Rhodoferax koreense]|uniref:2-dehydropantoate 2-reductase n=1 Tax=Rhodoferax koreensis TaxID=1842727 RepID=A0A1P8K0V7_9BURK|nr:hypothetical protein RD110_22480 [Rhodoferax koreense]